MRLSAGPDGRVASVSSAHIFAVVACIAAITVAGDYFLKLASQQPSALHNRWFLLGFVIYGFSAFGWVFAMRHMKLATIGVIYSLSTVLLLAVLGVAVFGESLNRYEVAGVGLAVISIVLLARFSS